MLRTHTCGELRKTHIGQTITLSGRVDNLRDMGGLIFIALRDRYGVTQVSYDPSSDGGVLTEQLSSLKNEYCIQVTGQVVARPDGQTNTDMATGEIEVVITSLTILNTCKELPYAIVDEPATSEGTRLKYRYLDLRRRPVLDNIKFKAKMMHFTRNWFTDADFLEVQTPIFTVSSPEGARDYLIPSRVNPGKFYAMPQAPQQYKQLLMVGGVDKYFQIAPCFRDEDPRADRHSCEFYQIDAEMSFVEQDDVFAIAEGYIHDLIPAVTPHKEITIDFIRIPYHEAIDKYGSDKPDLRFGMQFVDISELVKDSGFGVFANTVKEGGVVKAIKLDGQTMSRKEIDAITKVAKEAGAGGLAYMICEEGGVRSPIAKFFSEEELAAIRQSVDATDGDMIFFGAGSYELVAKVLNKVRLALRDQYDLADINQLAFVWITDFPLYEYDEGREQRDFGHNPFSHVIGGLEGLKTDDLSQVQTTQYDMVCNGYEILSGSIRNHDPKVLVAAFEKVGMGEADVKEKFGAMYKAFQYGCPPHGGFAFGFDRLMMILCDEDNIREVYAFPKSGKAEDVMMGAPSEVDDALLDEAGVVLSDKSLHHQGNTDIYNAICSLLNEHSISFKNILHVPTKTSQESATIRGVDLKIGGKALVVKVDDAYKLFVLSAERKLSISKLKDIFGTEKIRFATTEELKETTGLVPGSVPPFGKSLLPFQLYVDESITENASIAFNAGLLTHSIIMNTNDYITIASPSIMDVAE